MQRISLCLCVIFLCSVSSFAQWQSWGNYQGEPIFYQTFTYTKSGANIFLKRGKQAEQVNVNCVEKTIQHSSDVHFKKVVANTFGEWVSDKACIPVFNKATVITPRANFVDRPASNAKRVVAVKKGEKLALYTREAQNGWYEVGFLGGRLHGWIYGNSIKLDEDEVDEYINKILAQSKPVDKWTLISTGQISDYYLNSAKVVRSGDHIQFWIKLIPKNKSKYLNTMASFTASATANPDSFIHSMVQYNGLCKERKLRAVQEVGYWADGTVDSWDVSERNISLSSVVPDSVGETLLTGACFIKP